tara:strand:+ start:10 stop:843 length:834 start_codon:yes stop_codon:yes gene_type:complete
MKCFIIVDEIDTWAGDTKTANMLKSLLTQKTTKLERKNKDAINIEDFSNYAFISNNDNFLKVEGKADRRYLINTASPEYTGDKDYFNILNLDMGKSKIKLTKKQKYHADKVAKHFFHYIMNRILDNFDSRDIPQTETLKDMKISSTPVICSFFQRFLTEVLDEKIKSIESRKIYTAYQNFCKKSQEPQKYKTTSTFMRKVKQTFQLIKNDFWRGRNCSMYSCNRKHIKKQLKLLNQKYLFADDLHNVEINLTGEIESSETSDSDFDPDIDSDIDHEI